MKKILVLISGRGSNLAALLEAVDKNEIAGRIVHVISNRADAGGLNFARERGIPTTIIPSKDFNDREAFDMALGDAIAKEQPDLIVLAGFMRILGEKINARFAGKIINIHPALLPSYPGLHTHRRALDDGVKWHGCTVHFVTLKVDIGPIIGQAVVPVLPDDDEGALAARVLESEHRLLVDCVRWFCEDRLTVRDNKVILHDEVGSACAQQHPQG
ncbi:MAG: phosphoribosylglycinamide formyltransferase [Burkholderiales bacterium]|nr:phosphoribosylglycinamide formyltransferase [Burkholderiales bacterium]